MFNGVPMSSDMLDEAVEEKAIAQQDQPEEKKKVTVKIAPKKRVSIKKKVETTEEKATEEAVAAPVTPVEDNKPQEEEVKPKKRGRKPAKTLQEYKYENKRLKMEVELLRDFLQSVERM